MNPARITGRSRIGYSQARESRNSYRAFDPARYEELPETFSDASPAELDEAIRLAALSFRAYRALPAETRAGFLEAIAGGMEESRDLVIGRAVMESGLTAGRLQGELSRTTNQLRMFAQLIREGSWLDAVIVTGEPDRKPAARPDLRRMRIPLGPVVVFAASNFPLAFSVAGGDTASALAAGNPVIVKAHPSHPGTSEIVADMVLAAAAKTGLPDGVFSLVHGGGYDAGNHLVTHELVKAVAFTGSFQGGMALYRRAQEREVPIPVFAEMGSTNPVFLLPEIMRKSPGDLGRLLCESITLGAGQFCTKPGIIVVRSGAGLEELRTAIAESLREKDAQTMLDRRIAERFASSRDAAARHSGLEAVYAGEENEAGRRAIRPRPFIGQVTAAEFLRGRELRHEVFGPFALIVACESREAMLRVAESLDGQLTVTIHGTEAETAEAADLLEICREKAGRLLFGGVPTGVEVCAAMQHGGPFPATTDGRFTSVGTAAIQRFARPICFQNCADSLLPDELRDANPRGIMREVDGTWTRDPIAAARNAP